MRLAVRDGARHKQALAAKGNAQLSSGEKVLYENARQLLSAEIGVACAIDPAQAHAWIEEQITAPAGSDGGLRPFREWLDVIAVASTSSSPCERTAVGGLLRV